MAQWDDLPGEVRNQIYRFLLRNKHYVIEPQGEKDDGLPVQNGLHPAILCTSKAIKNEAISILYEENLFHYECPFFCVKWVYDDDHFSHEGYPASSALMRMKHISIRFPLHSIVFFLLSMCKALHSNPSMQPGEAVVGRYNYFDPSFLST